MCFSYYFIVNSIGTARLCNITKNVEKYNFKIKNRVATGDNLKRGD